MSKIYSIESHATDLLEALEKQRQNTDFCDVRVSVESQIFHAHRNVLSAASPYFHAMFTGGMAEEKQDTVHIHGVSADIFRVLHDFIYTSELHVTEETCQDLLTAADMLDMSIVVEACCEFLFEQMEPANCLGIYMLAENFELWDVCDGVANYVGSHFIQVTEVEEFLTLPKKLLIEYLESDILQVHNEFQVLTAAVKWIMHEPDERTELSSEVLEAVRFQLLPSEQLKRYIEECPNPNLKDVLQSIADRPAEKNNGKPEESKRFGSRTIFLVGGRDYYPDEHPSPESYNPCYDTWEKLPEMNGVRDNLGAAVLNGLVYAVGGFDRDGSPLGTVESYNPATKVWSMEPPMTVPRCYHGVCTCIDKIFAVGGMVPAPYESEWTVSDTVEAFDPKVGTWTVVGKLSTPRFCMAVAENGGLLYVIGGSNHSNRSLATVERYDPVTGLFVPLANMPTRKTCMGVAVLKNYIYVICGYTRRTDYVDTMERYSIEDNTWTNMSPLPEPCANLCAAVVEDIIYVMGGSDDVWDPRPVNTLRWYVPQENEWHSSELEGIGRFDSAVAVL